THSVSAASSKDQASTTSYVNDVMFSFFSNQSNALQLDNKDLEQIDTDDLEEMDLKWQVAMLTIRVKRFIKKTGRKLDLNGKETIVFDRTTFKCYNCHRRDKTGLGYDGQMNESDLNEIHVNESEVLNNVFDNHKSDADDDQVNDRFKKDNYVFKYKVSETITSVPKIETNASKTSKDSLEKSKTVRSGASLIEEWESDSEDENVFKPGEVKKIVKPSLENIKFVNARDTAVENENKAKKPRKFNQSPRDKRVMLCLDIKICAKDKNFSSIWAYTIMILPRVHNHHGRKCVHPGYHVKFQGEVVYTTLLSMVYEAFCIREKNCC
nr:ribonuclease H-like domain-containing protein [Tanacetum cinerariifolium]